MYDKRISNILADFDNIPIPDQIPPALPLLDYLRCNFKTSGAFRGLDVLFIQHHLGPLVPRIQAMREDGLDLARSWFVDIPYSTNGSAMSALRELGCPASQATEIFDDPLRPYASTQKTRVADLLRKLAKRDTCRSLLVIDDGAYFSRALLSFSMTEPELAQGFRGAAVVEQTTRGHRYLKKHLDDVVAHYGLRVVSIARTQTKTTVESPFIGAAVARAILRAIEAKQDFVDHIQRIAVIGYGPVGQATVRALRVRLPDSRIDVIDINTEKHADILQEGATPYRALPTDGLYDLVVGCTGYNSFQLHQRAHLRDDALLASGSSAAVEFNRAGFVELADQLPNDEIEVLDREKTIAYGLHATIEFQQEERKTFSLLNSGFPANFDGKIECLPVRLIQPTHALLYAAAVQALDSTEPGFNMLAQRTDEWIAHHALEGLAE